jgi:cytochrome oxidase assembly protein ShyY1
MLVAKRLFQEQRFLRRGREELSSLKTREKFAYLKSLVALILIAGCLWAAQWQYDRGVARHQRNDVIEKHSIMSPVALASVQRNPEDHEWQPVTSRGKFDASRQILLRNRYFEGKYGFELLTKFDDRSGRSYWVDCGWVQAGENAQTRPTLPTLPRGEVEITARLRLDTSLPRGAFFAIPTSSENGLIPKANAQLGTTSEDFYLDLLSGSKPELTPSVPAELPELSDGPHMAYALQWIFFGGLVGYGRFLIRREILSGK